MNDSEKKFVKDNFKDFILLKDKKPLHKLSEPCNFDDAIFREHAVLVPRGLVVVDVDDNEEAEFLEKYLNHRKYKFWMMNTTRGKHFWFRTPRGIPNTNKDKNLVGVTVDIKSWGEKNVTRSTKKVNKLTYVKISDRQWFNIDIQKDNLSNMPIELLPNKQFNELPSPVLIVGEGERRDFFWNRILPAWRLHFQKEYVIQVFKDINLFFDTPMKDADIESCFNSDLDWKTSQKPFIRIHPITREKEWIHHLFIDYMIETYNIKLINSQLYFFNGEYYQTNELELKRLMRKEYKELRVSQVNETYTGLEQAPQLVNLTSDDLDKTKLIVKNGVLDLKTKAIFDFSPHFLITKKLNVVYDPKQRNKLVDDFLIQICMNDLVLRAVLEEILGYCFFSNCKLQKAFILLGHGSNGKSTFLDAWVELIGRENVSGVTFSEIGDKFERASFLDKTLNIGEEINNKLHSQADFFKKLTSGDIINAEYKHKQSFSFKNTCKLFYTCNEMPPNLDKSEGLYRRLMIIPFDNVFVSSGDNVNLPEILKSETNKSALFNYALDGYDRLMVNNHFTISDRVEAAINAYKSENESPRQWLTYEYPIIKDLNARWFNEIYSNYGEYCRENKLNQYRADKFKKWLIRYYADNNYNIILTNRLMAVGGLHGEYLELVPLKN